MCGIHGFCWKDQDKSIDKMISAASHRGPDGSGSWGDAHITLGHNLLSIVDSPTLSAQPWKSNDHVMVYNGEVYNYKALKSSLSYDFKTDTDTEVLLAGYEKYGKQFLHKIDGMFAVAIYNVHTKKLLLARDSNGAKPLYYGYLNGKLAFSSEISSLLDIGFERKVSKEGFRHYFYSGLTAGPVTCFHGITRLAPGQIVEIDLANGVEFSSNINNDQVKIYTGSEADLPHLIQDKFKQAVSSTLMGRRKTGLFLSGGMDSSAILYEMAQSLGLSPNTFSTRFDIPGLDADYNSDANAAKKLADLYKVPHSEVLFNEQNWVDNLDKTVLALSEPRQGKSYPAYYATNKLLSDAGVVVTLSGDGGDELLAGYKHYLTFSTFKERLNSLRLRHRTFRDASKNMTIEDQNDYLMSWIPKGGLTGDSINDFMYIDSLHTLSEDFLVRNDKLGMAFGMESRFPFMCSVFKDFVRGIPGKLKATPSGPKFKFDLHNKRLFRAAYAGKLPAFITKKKKTGWRAPTDAWVIGKEYKPAKNKSPMRDYIRNVLSDKNVRDIFEISSSDIDDRYLNNVLHTGPRKLSGKPSAGPGLGAQKELFTVVMFAAWYKKFKMSF
jgi:asparagine synthase (glutamine-hydrolysing)